MDSVRSQFSRRRREIYAYLGTLRFIETSGDWLRSRNGHEIRKLDTDTKHVLKASVFVHLYNLIESTVTASFLQASQEFNEKGICYEDLNDPWQKAWLRTFCKTDEPLNEDNRLTNLLHLCDHISGARHIDFVPKIRSNVDDQIIEDLSKRHGVELKIPSGLQAAVKRHVVDEKGPLQLVRVRRNELAHGLSSFADCGQAVTVRELRGWTAVTFRYLRCVLGAFEFHLSEELYRRQP